MKKQEVFGIKKKKRWSLKEAITTEQMYKIENIGHDKFGMKRILMMENAGANIADFIVNKFKNMKKLKIVAVCGTGNNGGDAMVASRHLASSYINGQIKIIFLGDPLSIKTEEASVNFEIINKMNRTVELIRYNKKLVDVRIKNNISNADIIIDSIFGTGIKGNIYEPHSTIIGLVNKSKAYVIAVDIPSGLNPDTGEILSNCIEADSTITFHRIKYGLLNNKKLTGNIVVRKIGIPLEAEDGIL